MAVHSIQDEFSDLASASFSAPPPDAVWRQVNIGLVRTNGDAVPSARAMFRAVAPFLDRWRRDGLLHWWFFMRKPPDIRLRVYLRPDGDDALKTLDGVLRTLGNQKSIRGHYWNRYLPEQGRFGGSTAMTLVHAYFHVDSSLWLHLDTLESRGLRTLEPDRLLPAVLHDMFLCCCGPKDAVEPWGRLAELIQDLVPIATSNAPLTLVALDALSDSDGFHVNERFVLQSYVHANRLLGRGIRQLSAETEPEHPISLIASTIALFNLNRHGFPGERSGAMAAGACTALAGITGRPCR